MSQRTLTAALLVALAGAPAAPPAADASATAIVVPFSYVHHEPIVSVRIGNSGPYAFLVDTDTAPSAIDVGVARELHLQSTGPCGSGTGEGSGKSVACPVTIPHLQVGELAVARIDALTIDLSALRTAFRGGPIVGILGTSLLNDRVVEIDYPCRTIAFLPDAILEPFTARFDAASGVTHSSDVWVGSQRVIATFDTGDNGYSFVTAKGIADLHLETTARSGAVLEIRGYNGAAQVTKGTLHALRIGRILIGSVATSFEPSASDHQTDVNIGNRVLEQFVATFDYQRGLLTLSPARPRSSCRR